MQILEHHDDRLHETLAQEQALHAVEGLPAALGRVETLPRRIVDVDIEQPQERRQERLERAVQ